ncbi:hypothetical protein [Microcystis aeruginosa]|nr:hypothetical protein [Microcystis aeruginosa]TRT97527.1 MAG: hypothetical protein EWV61_18670 [Microcystis aeruginosa Ma_AC_P_19900807_S300]ARI81951.1 hypothetical protein BH695_2672 [Microcystis aeruginosa PCC 7806SL]ELS48804.1 hypothetical protein C789_1396 [Microcystis aeruginosa FACHB-905 = DIANCHI905]UGS11068.1 hypothetical protein LRR78_10985 [Microcystis aeruginosa FACHB-905 = DIANCHI905]WKX62205.1 hypothetical protein Q3H53_002194 [Microcystis aeruginosa PCC 7806]
MLGSGEIRLSDEDVETLRKAKDAYKGNYSCASEKTEQILIEASRWLLEAFLEEYRSQTETSSYTIPLNVLKDWMTPSPQSGTTKDVLKTDGKKLYLQNEYDFKRFENKKKSEYRIEDINDNSIHLTLEDINVLLEQSILKVIGISTDSLRFCTQKDYKKTKIQTKGRPSRQSYIVQAYCEVLGLDFDSLQCCQLHQNPKNQQTNNEKIYHVLTTKFNYTNLVNFTSSIVANPLREGTIYIPPCPHQYRVLCLRRLEKEILITNNLPVKPIVFKFQGDGQEEWDSYSLHEHFFNNSGGIKNLKNNNFCLIFEGIDCADFDCLKDIDSFWQNLTKKASKIQNSPISGFLLMIWLDYGNSNDWRDKDKLSELSPIHCLQIDSRFEKLSFQKIIPTFAQQLQLGCDLQDETTLQELWENSNQGNIEDTLKAFYQQFKGQLSRENRWLNYP